MVKLLLLDTHHSFHEDCCPFIISQLQDNKNICGVIRTAGGDIERRNHRDVH